MPMLRQGRLLQGRLHDRGKRSSLPKFPVVPRRIPQLHPSHATARSRIVTVSLGKYAFYLTIWFEIFEGRQIFTNYSIADVI